VLKINININILFIFKKILLLFGFFFYNFKIFRNYLILIVLINTSQLLNTCLNILTSSNKTNIIKLFKLVSFSVLKIQYVITCYRVLRNVLS